MRGKGRHASSARQPCNRADPETALGLCARGQVQRDQRRAGLVRSGGDALAIRPTSAQKSNVVRRHAQL
jgi:hypothetical protein